MGSAAHPQSPNPSACADGYLPRAPSLLPLRHTTPLARQNTARSRRTGAAPIAFSHMSAQPQPTTTDLPEILARGPWALEQVKAHWREEHFEPSAEHARAADAAIAELQQRGSPSHDGVAARLVDYRQDPEGIALELQPLRWALRLVAGDASASVAALCVTRSADGRWLAGRRAQWVSSWAGRWALGAGGAVDLGREPGRHARAGAAGGVVGRARARARRGAAAPASPDGDVRRAGLARRGRRGPR